jgi:hypothetical protein
MDYGHKKQKCCTMSQSVHKSRTKRG